jgi:hypothetical protein
MFARNARFCSAKVLSRSEEYFSKLHNHVTEKTMESHVRGAHKVYAYRWKNLLTKQNGYCAIKCNSPDEFSEMLDKLNAEGFKKRTIYWGE